jgi:hypothetical protein
MPILFQGEEVARVNGGMGGFSVEERRVAIAERLSRATEDWALDPKTMTVREAPQGTEILLGGRSIMVVTDADAAVVGRPRGAVATEYAGRFRQAIELARDRQSLPWLLLGSLKSVLATVALLAALAMMRSLGRRALRFLDTARAREAGSVVAVGIHGLCVLLGLVLRLLVWPLVLVLVLTYLHFVLHFFPATVRAGQTLHESVLGILRAALDRFAAYSPNLAVLVLIGLVTHFLLKVASTASSGAGCRWKGSIPTGRGRPTSSSGSASWR